MNLKPHRPWITPLVIGAFLLSAVTGVLMFFHLDSGLNKTAHEWFSWAMVIGVGLHILQNLTVFKRYFSQTTALVVVGVFATVLALSFLPVGGGKGGGKEAAMATPAKALAKAPITLLAQVAGISTDEVKAKLQAQGLTVANDQQSVADLVGGDLRKQLGLMSKVLPQTSP